MSSSPCICNISVLSAPCHHSFISKLDIRCSSWLPEENINLIVVAAEQVAFRLVNHVRSEILANDTVPWLAYSKRANTFSNELQKQFQQSLFQVDLITETLTQLQSFSFDALTMVLVEFLSDSICDNTLFSVRFESWKNRLQSNRFIGQRSVS